MTTGKPTYEELEYRIMLLEREARWRKEAQRALQEREAYLKILFEYAPDIYILCDAKGKLIDANRAAEKVTGFDRSDVLGKDLFEAGIIDANQFEKAVNMLSKVASKFPTTPDEFIIHKKNGQSLAVELRAYPVELQNEPVVLMIARDITRYRQDIESCRHLGDWFQRLFELDLDPVLVFNDDTGRIETANKASRCLFGYSAKEFANLTIEDLCNNGRGREPSLEPLREVTPGEAPVAFRGFKTKTGAALPAKVIVRKFSFQKQTWTVVRIR
ncbi:MAG: PAS domain S-box protein [Desulfobacterales bacterium]|nr:PAS domain S-box protein [Desulfobacterales bacterium]